LQSLQLTLVVDLGVPVALLVGVACGIWDWQDSVLPQNTAESLISWRLRLFLRRLALLLVLVLVLLLRAVLILTLILSLVRVQGSSRVAGLVWSPLSLIVLLLLDLGVWHKFQSLLWPLLLLICAVLLSDINLRLI